MWYGGISIRLKWQASPSRLVQNHVLYGNHLYTSNANPITAKYLRAQGITRGGFSIAMIVCIQRLFFFTIPLTCSRRKAEVPRYLRGGSHKTIASRWGSTIWILGCVSHLGSVVYNPDITYISSCQYLGLFQISLGV